MDYVFSSSLLDREVKYFECPRCGYVQTETPTWLEDAYASPINVSDTGLMARNQANSAEVLAALALLGKTDGRVTDVAGGYGILVRLLRDRGINAYWSDPYCQNLLAQGFEDDVKKSDLVTAFEAFEHFVHPFEEAQAMFDVGPNILLSTELIGSPAPAPSEWWYYGRDHGQHVGFLRGKTLRYLADRFDKTLLTDGRSYHLLTEQKVSTRAWKIFRRLAHHAPRLLTRKLSSRTWEDHLQMSAGEHNAK